MATVPLAYVDTDAVKAAMPDVTWGGKYDALLKELTEAASRKIDEAVGFPPGSYRVEVDEIRYFEGSGQASQWIDEIATTPTEVAMDLIGDQVSYTVISASDYEMWPKNAVQLGQPFYRMDMRLLSNPTYYHWYAYPNSIRVTGKWGWSTTVPPHVAQVTKIQVIRWFKRAQQAYEDAGAITQLGQLRYVKGIDPDLEVFLKHAIPGRIAI